MPVSYNAKTGQALRLDESGQWVTTQTANNPDTGEMLALDGSEWKPIGDASSLRFQSKAAQLSPDELTVARTKNDDFGKYLRQQATKRRDGETEDAYNRRLYGSLPKTEVGKGEGMLRAGGQGLSFGAMDEIVAMGAAALDPYVKGSGGTFDDRYDAYLQRERSKIAEFRDTNPVLAYGSEIAGSIPTAIATSVATGGGLIPRMAKEAAQAFVQGGIYGFNAGEGGVENRASSGLTSGAIAAPIAAAAVPVSSVISAGVRNFMSGRVRGDLSNALPAGTGKVSRGEYDLLAKPFLDDPNAMQTGAAAIANGGPDAMLADASKYYDDLLDVIVQRSGKAGTKVSNAIESRASLTGKQLSSTLDNVLGSPQGKNAMARNISQRTAAGRKSAYDAAYAVAVDYASDAGRNIEDIFSRIPGSIKQKAVDLANRSMQWDQVGAPQILAKVDDAGNVTFSEMPNMVQLDYIKRALGTLGSEAVDQFGRPTSDGRLYQNMATALRDAMVEAVPEYKTALRVSGDKLALDNALRSGYDLLSARTTREMAADAIKGMSQAEKDMAKLGVRSQIDDTLANVARTITDGNMDAREAIKLLRQTSSRANRAKLTMLLGTQKTKQLFDQIEKMSRALELRSSVARNSATYRRTYIGNQMDEASSTVLGELKQANPGEAAKGLVRNLMGTTARDTQMLDDALGLRLGGILTDTTGQQAQDVISILGARAQGVEDAAMRARDISGLLGRVAPGAGENWKLPRRALGLSQTR